MTGRRRELHQTKGLMSRTRLCTCVLNLGTFLCRPLQNNNVKWPPSRYFGERDPQWLIFGIFFWNSALSVHVKPGQVFRPMGVLNTFLKLLHSNVKYKFVFNKVSSPPSPSSLLKLPNKVFKKLLRLRQGLRRLKSEFIFYLRISRYS